MAVPDHYAILQITPQASPLEIKKAYRRLAQQYHPDKTHDDPWAAAHFTAIKEAYETLSTPWKKQQYLEARWYARSKGEEPTTSVITPSAILQEVLKIDREAALADVFRLDSNQLVHEINQVLDTVRMECLLSFRDEAVNQQIVCILCRPLLLLTPAEAGQFTTRLQQLAGDNEKAHDSLLSSMKTIRSNYLRQRYQWLLIPLAIILLYGLIRFTKQ